MDPSNRNPDSMVLIRSIARVLEGAHKEGIGNVAMVSLDDRTLEHSGEQKE